MAKRKKAKSRKKSTTRKGGTRTTRAPRKSRARSKQGSASAEAPSTVPPTAIVPAPAPPFPEDVRRRERETRGGKSTLSTHELLAEVPLPPRARIALPKSAESEPAPPAPPTPQAEPGMELSQSQIYETLAALLVPYARRMESEMHPKIGFCLKVKSARTGRETHFGAVQALPDGVAFHLFPLYGHPDLLEGISPDLFNRMRGKTCFHFETLHAGLVAELAQLTHAGFERFLGDGVF